MFHKKKETIEFLASAYLLFSPGLKLTLNIEESEYVAELSHDVGARISILPQEQMPFPDDEGISVMPGRVTFIGLRKVSTVHALCSFSIPVS